MSQANGTDSTPDQIIAALAVAARDAHDRAREKWKRHSWISPSAERYATIATCGHRIDGAWRVPAADGLVLKGPERALVAAGWRFIAAPKFKLRASDNDAPALDWDTRSWLAVPPEDIAQAARTFAKKRDALAWAAEISAANGCAA